MEPDDGCSKFVFNLWDYLNLGSFFPVQVANE